MSTNPYNDDKRLLELLERWQSGDFTRADEQELQSLADSDDFRREAVEGFWASPETEHQKHISALRSRIRSEAGNGKRLYLPQVLTAVAALLLLILATIWLFPGSNDANPMAKQEPAQSTQQSAPPPEPQPSEQEIAQVPETPALQRSSSRAKADQGSGASMESMPAMNSVETKMQTAPAPIAAKEDKIADEMAAAKPAASQQGYGTVIDDLEGVDQSPGNSAPRAKSSQAEQYPSQAKDAAKKKAPGAVINDSAPVNGWVDFQDYLRKNARLTEAARQNNITGTVRLKFQLDDLNQPVNFQILRKLGFGCEDEAIRLVKAYSWQRGNNPDITVDVPFVR